MRIFARNWVPMTMLEDIKHNFERLIALYESERQRGARLLTELQQAKSDIESSKKQITDLKRQIENLTLAHAFTASPDDNGAAKEKIEKLIREIDKCISLLEK